MDEIMVVWELDSLCHLPGNQIDQACRLAGELGHSCHRSSAEGVLLVNSPFTGRQIALIVESEGRGAAPGLGGALQELLTAASARVNLVRVTGPMASLPLGGHLLLWLADGAEQAPLVIIPGKYCGSTRLASLLNEELSSAARLTPGTEVLFLEAPRGPLPASMPAVLIQCPAAPPGAAGHWAAGLKQGLARHFSGEGTSLSFCGPTAADGSGENSREKAVQVFWQKLKQAVPQARVTAAGQALFNLADDSAAVATPLPDPVKKTGMDGLNLAVIKSSRTGMGQILGRPGGVWPAPFGRLPSTATVPRPPVPPFTYPRSPYPVTYAPFQRPFDGLPHQEAVPFTRSQPGAPARDAATRTESAAPEVTCGPGSPLR